MRGLVLEKLGGVWGALAWAALVCALVFSLLSAAATRDRVRLLEDGALAQGEVVEKRTHRNWRVGGTFGTDYILRYRFDADRQGVMGRDLVSEALFRAVRVGGKVEVRYWRGDARVSEVVEAEAVVATDVARFLSRLAWSVFAVASALWVWRRR